ncbi:MAG: hypothetical protein ACD_41C00135G0002 [uncultured bacterium]|nr:MAG: hypothetical protein ACD_41C00135G0002 [uncultured bacterium]
MRSYLILSSSAIAVLFLIGTGCTPVTLEPTAESKQQLEAEKEKRAEDKDTERADQVVVQDEFKPAGQPSELSPGVLQTEFMAIVFPANLGVVEQLEPGRIVATTANNGVGDTTMEEDEFRVELRYGNTMNIDEERATFRAQYTNATEEIAMSQFALRGSTDDGEVFQYAVGYLWEFRLGRMLIINGYANTPAGIAKAQQYIEEKMTYQWTFAAERE